MKACRLGLCFFLIFNTVFFVHVLLIFCFDPPVKELCWITDDSVLGSQQPTWSWSDPVTALLKAVQLLVQK